MAYAALAAVVSGAVISSTEALSLTQLPGRLVIVGAGYIGLELGTAYRKLGAANRADSAKIVPTWTLSRRTNLCAA